MSLVLPTRTIDTLSAFEDPEDFKVKAFEMIGDLSAIDVYLNRVLTLVYIGYERTSGGIIKPTDTKKEDIYQGKTALVLKVGPTAFQNSGSWDFAGQAVNRGDWVTFKIGNSSQIEFNKVACRIVMDQYIETRVRDPRMVTS